MKKTIALLLTLVMMLTLVACGTGGTILTIKTNEGKTENLTFKELYTIHEENSASYEKKYRGATISFVGVVKKVENNLVQQSIPGFKSPHIDEII